MGRRSINAAQTATLTPSMTSLLLFRLFLATAPYAEELPVECPHEFEGRIVRQIALRGYETTEEVVIRRELRHRLGEPFRCRAWLQEYKRLHNLDIFASIALRVAAVEHGVELHYTLKELPLLLPYPSIKRTDQDGWLVGLGGTTLNLFGRAFRIDFSGRFGGHPFFRTREMLLYTASQWLGGLPIGHEAWFQIIDTYNALKLFADKSMFLTVEFYPRFVERLEGIVGGGFVRVRHTPGAAYEFLGAGNADFIPQLTVGMRRDGHDDRGDPRAGVYSELRFTQHGGFLGGPANFQEFLLDLRGTTTFLKKHITMAFVLARQRSGEVPFYEWLHVGGPNTLRAYNPNPARHGDSEMLGGLEYRYALFERRPFSLFGVHAYAGLQIVAGADVALLWDTDAFAERRGFGAAFLGFHLVLPGVQRFRVEFGIQEDARTVGLTVGLYERTAIQRWRVR